MKNIITLLLFLTLSHANFSQSLTFSVTATDTACNGECSGSIEVLVTDGAPPYQYAINDLPPQDSSVFNDLCPGLYIIMVTDNVNAIRTIDMTINEASPLEASVYVLSSGNLQSGVINIVASGGTPPYTYSVNGLNIFPEKSNILSNVAPGAYELDITDTLGCTLSISAIVAKMAIENSVTISGNSLTANILADNYQWIDASTETEIDGATNNTFTASEIGKYRVEMTVNTEAGKNGINTKAKSAALVTISSPVYEIASLSLNTLHETNFTIYPNPAKNYVILPKTTIGKNYTIYNQLGKKLISKTSNTNEISIESLSEGLYFIKVDDLITGKFVVKD